MRILQWKKLEDYKVDRIAIGRAILKALMHFDYASVPLSFVNTLEKGLKDQLSKQIMAFSKKEK